MLQRVCSVINRRGRQNLVRTSVTLGYCLACHFFFLTHFDFICDLLLNRRMATWHVSPEQPLLVPRPRWARGTGRSGGENDILMLASYQDFDKRREERFEARV